MFPVLHFDQNQNLAGINGKSSGNTNANIEASSQIYIRGNFTIGMNNEGLAKCYHLVFEGGGNRSLSIDSNLSFIHEIITTTNTRLTIRSASGVENISICSSEFNFNGSMLFNNDKLAISNSNFGGRGSHIKMYYCRDKITTVNSTFNNVARSPEIYHPTGSLDQNSQPISTEGNFSYRYTRTPYFNYPISEIKFNATYTYNGNGINLNISSKLGAYLANDTVHLTENKKTFNISVNLSHPVYLKAVKNGSENVQLLFPFGSNLTIWVSSIQFISNSTFNYTGFGTNYIILGGTYLTAFNSSFNGNSEQYGHNGFYNPGKEGFILRGRSNLFMVGSNFKGQNLSEGSPVVSEDNSTFYFLPILKVMFEMYNKANYYNAGIIKPFGGNSSNFALASKINISTENNQMHPSSILPAYFQGNESVVNSIFSFSIFNRTQYFSLKTGSIFQEGSYSYTKYFNNLSSVRVNSSIRFNNSSIALNYSLTGVGATIQGSYTITIIQSGNVAERLNHNITLHKGMDYNYTIDLPRIKSFKSSNIEFNISLTFNNRIKNVTETDNIGSRISPLFSTYILKPVNLESGSEFSVYLNGTLLKSRNGIIKINSLKSKLEVLATSSGFMAPANKSVIIHPGYNFLKYFHKSGEVVFDGNIGNKTTIEISGNNYTYSEGLAISLEYGNYSVILNNSGRITEFNLFVHKNLTITYLYVKKSVAKTDWTLYWSTILASTIAVALGYNISRRKITKVCPVCMKETAFDRRHSHK